MADVDNPCCVRCGEDFPIAAEPAHWRMGAMRPLAKASRKIRQQLRYDAEDIRGVPHLCGNCWFDLTDDDY